MVIGLFFVLNFAGAGLAFQPVYVMGSANIGGTYYNLGGIIAEMVNTKVPGVMISVLPTNGSGENVELLGRGLCQFALMDSFAVMAYKGKDLYYENPQTYMKAVAPLYPEVARIIVPADSSVRSLADLEGKKVVVGRKGSGTLVTAQQILQASGLGNGKIIPAYLGLGEGLLALQKGTVEGVIFVGPLGGGSSMEQETIKETRMFGLDESTVDKLLKGAPYWRKFTIPGGTFEGQDEDILTIGAWTTLYCREELADELVYKVAEVLYNHAHSIESYLPGSVKLSPEQIGEVLIPLHPGAAQFHEKGHK